jgi:glycopeptide antibiotics resistance protein
MKKRLIPAIIFLAYIAILVKVMVFKGIPAIKVEQLMLNFGGTDSGHGPNFVPFATIGPYLLGYKGWIIAGINLAGNIVLPLPIGFLAPLVYPKMTWKKALMLAVATGLSIEIMQTVLHVGIFDIDDVILNAFGVMIGYFAFRIISKWARAKQYGKIIVAAIAVIAAAGAAFYFIYPWGQSVHTELGAGAGALQSGEEGDAPQSGDLCGGTSGIGQIVVISSNSFTIERKDGTDTLVNLMSRASIKTPAGSGSLSDLKIGDRVTLVGDPNPDGSFSADAVFVCS